MKTMIKYILQIYKHTQRDNLVLNILLAIKGRPPSPTFRNRTQSTDYIFIQFQYKIILKRKTTISGIEVRTMYIERLQNNTHLHYRDLTFSQDRFYGLNYSKIVFKFWLN